MVNLGSLKGKILSPAKAGSGLILDYDPRLESLGYSQSSANADEHPPAIAGGTDTGSGRYRFRVLTRVSRSSPFHVIALQKLFHLFPIVQHRRKQRLVVLLALEFQNVARATGADQVF